MRPVVLTLLHFEPWDTACPRRHCVAHFSCGTCGSRLLAEGNRLALVSIGSNPRWGWNRGVLGFEALPACHICTWAWSTAKSTVRRDPGLRTSRYRRRAFER